MDYSYQKYTIIYVYDLWIKVTKRRPLSMYMTFGL